MNITSVLFDPELGYTGFIVQRTTYRRQDGSSVPSNQTFPQPERFIRERLK